MDREQLAPAPIFQPSTNRRIYFACKRAFDLVGAVALAIVTAPVMLLLAVAIKLDSPGSILFKQTRVGQGGRQFLFYKFRTMYDGSDNEVHRRHAQSYVRNELSGAERIDERGQWHFKLGRDPRVTRVGAFLRRTSLDELPQIFNVIKGEMSLVGPRPPLPYEVSEYQDWHLGRLEAVPGITGSWQVQGRGRVPFDDMVRMDLEYIAHQSLWLDFKILMLTIPAVVSGNGAE